MMRERLHGVDGLRGIAVAAVVLYHLEVPGLAEAGFLGVDLFFVISGFLITALLVTEWDDHGRIDVPAFVGRRMRRLLPAAFAMVLAAWGITRLCAPDALARLEADVPAALLYASNWWQIHSHQSYFESFGRPPVLQHLWSLAVEEQYYLLWPPFLLLMLCGGRRLPSGLAALLLALASAAWMAAVYVPGDDRAYLGSDTHAMGLLAGSALGCAAVRWRLPGVAAGTGLLAAVLQVLGLAGLGLLLAMMWRWNVATPWLFQGGFLAAALLAALALLAAAGEGGLLARLLAVQPLRWLGTRSYSIYLWHWPLCVWLRTQPDVGHESAALTLAKLALSLLAGELSWRWFERGWSSRTLPALRRALPLALVASLPLLAPATLWQAHALPVTQAAIVTPPPRPEPEPVAPASSEALPVAEPELAPQPQALSALPAPAAVLLPPPRLLVVGDSVMLGARGYLERALPGSRVDAMVGRQFSEGLKIVSDLRAQSALPDVVVLHLGTNGYIVEGQMRQMLRALSDRRLVVLVNVHARRRWTEANNEIIDRVGHAWPNVVVAQWDAASQEHPEYFVSDGIHLTGAGMGAVTREVARAAGLAVAQVPLPATRREHVLASQHAPEESSVLPFDASSVSARPDEQQPPPAQEAEQP